MSDLEPVPMPPLNDSDSRLLRRLEQRLLANQTISLNVTPHQVPYFIDLISRQQALVDKQPPIIISLDSPTLAADISAAVESANISTGFPDKANDPDPYRVWVNADEIMERTPTTGFERVAKYQKSIFLFSHPFEMHTLDPDLQAALGGQCDAHFDFTLEE